MSIQFSKLYADSNKISTKNNMAVEQKNSMFVSYMWNTYNVSPCIYIN